MEAEEIQRGAEGGGRWLESELLAAWVSKRVAAAFVEGIPEGVLVAVWVMLARLPMLSVFSAMPILARGVGTLNTRICSHTKDTLFLDVGCSIVQCQLQFDSFRCSTVRKTET